MTPPICQGMPAYYFLASTRPLSAHRLAGRVWRATASALQSLQPDTVHSHHDFEPFRQAALRHLTQDQVFIPKRRAGWNFSAKRCFAPMCRCPPA